MLKRIIGKQPRATDTEKRRMAIMAHELDRTILEMGEHIVTIDSFRRWHRQLIANTYTSHHRGRPRIPQEVEDLIVRLAKENPHWGEDSIADRCKDLGQEVSDRTVSNVLRRHAIPPSPEREKTCDWDRFITANWGGLMAIDMAVHEIPNTEGTQTIRNYALYAIHLDTREIRLLGVTPNPNNRWMTNMGRKLCDMADGFALGKTHCLMDGDKLWSEGLKECMRSIGCEPKKLPPQPPNLNAYIERFIGTTRRELRADILPMSTEGLKRALREHVTYYNEERNHQSLPGHRCPVDRHDNSSASDGPVRCRSRLGKTLNFYYRAAS